MNILVFGKDGQLGKAFKTLLDSLTASVNHHVMYIGRLECDLSNKAAVLALLNASQADLIINASAYTAVDQAEAEIDLAFAVNAKAPELMALYALKNEATFLHYSTDCVFDGRADGFYKEDDVRNPLGIYGKSKAAGEEAIEKVFANASKGQYAIFRTSWVYGDGGNFIRTILRLGKGCEELKIIHDQHGVPTSANWLAEVSLALVMNQKFEMRQFTSGIYHAVPNGEATWYDFACLVIRAAVDAGVALKARPDSIKPIPTVEFPLPAPRPMNSRMDNSKLQMSLQDSVLKVSSSYNENQNMPSFPVWDGMVQEYVSQLAKDGLI